MQFKKGVGVSFIAVGSFFLLFLAAAVVFAADSGSTDQEISLWQWVSGLFGLITTGAGGFIIKNIKIIKDGKESVHATTQALTAISVFVRDVPETFRKNPEYIDMLKKIDKALEETADVLGYFKRFEKTALVFRNMINDAAYNKSLPVDSILKKIKPQLDAYNKALAQLSGK